jgi:hypothetical protein
MLLAAVVLSLVLSSASSQYGIYGFFCEADSAGMSLGGSEACWALGPGDATSKNQKGWLQMVRWAEIEPQNGVFDFTEFDKNLTLATAKGYEMVIMVEIVKGKGNFTTPEWVYDEGVPRVEYHGGGDEPENGNGDAPYYLDPKFQFFFQRLIRTVAAHMKQLSTQQKANILAMQVALGITGDDRPWNGVPVNKSFMISDADWGNYTKVSSLQV